jgi:hypothetical protein
MSETARCKRVPFERGKLHGAVLDWQKCFQNYFMFLRMGVRVPCMQPRPNLELRNPGVDSRGHFATISGGLTCPDGRPAIGVQASFSGLVKVKAQMKSLLRK